MNINAIDEQTSDSLPDPASGLPGGPTTYTSYDPIGRVVTQTSPLPPGEVPGDGLDATTYAYTFGTTTNPGVTVTTTLADPTYGTNGGGPKTTDVYDQNGNLVSETTPSPVDGSPTTVTYQYDPLGRPAQVTNPNNNELLGPTYDADGNVLSDTDLENGAVTSYTYNARNELVQTTGPYPDPQHPISGTKSESGTWSHSVEITVGLPRAPEPTTSDGTGGYNWFPPARTLTTYTLDDSSTTGNSVVWSFTGLTSGQQYEFQASWDFDSGNTDDATFSYYTDNSDSPSSAGTLDEQNAPRSDYVDSSGKLWQGMVVFTAAGSSATFTLASGHNTTLIPDVQLQKARPVATESYDPAGNTLSQTDPTGATESIVYDNLNRPITDTTPSPTGSGTVTTTTGYDLVGNVISTTSPSPVGDESFVTTTNTYDQQNNLESTTDANGDVTTFAHSALGDTLSLTDSDGNTTSWGVNHLGETTSQSELVAMGYFPDGTVQTALATSYNFYDPAGDLVESIDADGRAIDYAYDHLNGETNEYWYANASDAASDPSHESPLETTSYGYNSAGYVTSASNAAAAYGFNYDISGNVTDASANLLGADGTTVQLGATYDYNGNIASLAANIGGTPSFHVGDFTGFTDGVNDFTNNYAYDPMGDMTGITQTGDGVTSKSVTMSYDSDQRLASIDMYQSSGTSTLVAAAGFGYNGASELSDLTYNTAIDGTGTVLAGYHWDYNAAGAVSDVFSLNDTNPSDSPDAGDNSTWASATYSYDPTAQLLGASYSTSFVNAPTTDASESYDPNGNRASVAPASPTTTTTGADNRLLYDGNFYYTYDAEGNRTAKYQISGGSDVSLGTQSSPNTNAENITIYTWDNANQMTSATFYNTAAHWTAGTTTAAGEWTVAYGNDPFGRMVTRTATVTNADLSQTTTTENFIYDGQNIVLILDGDGNAIERELTGPAPDQVFASEDASTDVVNWYLTDNQGTVRDVVQSDGTTTTAVDHLVYSAYGQLSDQTAAPDVGERPTFYYNGTWQDAQTGMNKMGLRWADLADAVFASKDPIGFWSGTTNLSEYVGNSPTNFSDPSGLSEQSAAALLLMMGAVGPGANPPSAPSGSVGTQASGCGCVHRPVGTGGVSFNTGPGDIFVTRQRQVGGGWDGGPDGSGTPPAPWGSGTLNTTGGGMSGWDQNSGFSYSAPPAGGGTTQGTNQHTGSNTGLALAAVPIVSTAGGAAVGATAIISFGIGYGISRGTGLDQRLGNWWTPPVVVSENANGTTNVTVNSNYTIVILYGHGSDKNPHTFTVNGGQSFVGFIGCDANRTNVTIPASHRIPGLPIVKGDLNHWKDENGINQWDPTIQAANSQAAALAKQSGHSVTVVEILAYGNGLSWLQMPNQDSWVVKP